MSSSNGLSYSAAFSKGEINPPRKQNTSTQTRTVTHINDSKSSLETNRKHEPPSPSHIPQTGSEEEQVYTLTILTDKPLHKRMTELRKKYFPQNINKVAAHLTLFHALPGSKLECHIIPTIQEVTRQTSRFRVEATELFRLKKGFAVSVSEKSGGRQSKQVHRALQAPWKQEGFLSQQDAGGCRVHYTLMNKVDDELEIQNAYDEVAGAWEGDSGMAEGLALWKYDRGFWRWYRAFNFEKGGDQP
ncbi:hypothetical protein AC578_9032 [Pseudocercospora eumusae]|uniref:Uncharacterized protein n=1 Tax=Pseudocercospora eumusae TaxID=321146 RepID=A0A139H8M0_9PEZI|nr:hypothetical protein AC578_9032 [Pseudocercospora eumusae]